MTFEERERAVFSLTDEEVVKLSTSELKYVCKHPLMKIVYKAVKPRYVSPREVEKWQLGIGKAPRFEAVKPVLNRAGMSAEVNKRRKTITPEARTEYLSRPWVYKKLSDAFKKEMGLPLDLINS